MRAARAYVRLVTLPDVTNHHRSLMTDVTRRIRQAGRWNELLVPRVGVYVRWKFIYLSEDPKRKVISRPFPRSVSRDAVIPGAGNIGQGIMIFAEGDTKSKIYADISDGYSYRILGTAA